MRASLWLLCCCVSAGCDNSHASPQAADGGPIKFLTSCELDLSADGKPDLVLLLETSRGRELLVLLALESGYEAYLLSRDKAQMQLSCRFGTTLQETRTGRALGRVFQTPGAYVELRQPEGAAVAYFWDGNGFREVWTSD